MDRFLVKKRKISQVESENHPGNNSTQQAATATQNDPVSVPAPARINSTTAGSNDIGEFLGKQCTEEEKYGFLKDRWVPDELYAFPASGKRQLKFQRRWLFEFPWLAYSQKCDGAFCRFCFFFAPEEVGKGRNVKAKTFVTTPFNRWKDAKEQFRYHQKLDYHGASVVRAQNFVAVHEGKIVDVGLQVDTSRQEAIARNRKILSSIIETVILMGRQEMAGRGHRDSGPMFLETPAENDGNFRALLRFRVSSGDVALKTHFERTADLGSTRYISPKIQNELIEICGELITEKIVSKINAAGCVSILADETSDVSGIEQFSLCARYTENTNSVVTLREDFLTFVPVTDVTGQGLSDTLLSTCSALGIDLKFGVGQGYDGAAAMSGRLQGCAAKVAEKHPQMLYVHCASHSLDLAVSDACTVPAIRNTVGSIKEVISFFRISPKRQTAFEDEVKTLQAESEVEKTKKRRLTKLCETRWMEKLDAVITFGEFFLPTYSALESMQESGFDSETCKKAFAFQQTLKSSPFIVSLVIIENIFSVVSPVTAYLQGVTVDLSSAMDRIGDVSDQLKERRVNAASTFEELFAKAEKLAAEIGEEIKKNRIAKRQTQRANYDSQLPVDYFRQSIYIPFLDHYISQLDLRFLKHKATLSKVQNVIPHYIRSLSEHDINETVECILEQWSDVTSSCDSVIGNELRLWQRRWTNVPKPPRSFLDALNACDALMFPNVYMFLKVGVTLPVTTASNERSFSTLGRIKTYVRNSTGETRLRGLALLSVHREIPVDVGSVIDVFAQRGKRDFVL